MAEHLPFNQVVAGSIPARPTIAMGYDRFHAREKFRNHPRGTVVEQVVITLRVAANDRSYGALNLRNGALHDTMCHGPPAGQEPVKSRPSAFAVITGMRNCLSGSRISSSVAGAESRFERLMNADH